MSKSSFFYGGQAVIEGVMMRGPRHMAVAARDPDGRIIMHSELLREAMYRGAWTRWPFVRGAIVLGETLALGMRALNFSANVAVGGEAEETAIRESESGDQKPLWASVIIGVGLAAGIFFVLPVLLASIADNYISSPLLSNLVEKAIRLILILGYIVGIGLLPDVKRVFGYHGAEHKTINAYEAGVELTPANVRPFTLIHPRCGTTFLLVVVFVSFFVFSVFGRPPLVERILSRVVLIPFVAGISYELVRLGATNYHRKLVRAILAPGLALQRLTTREPDDTMLEVAIAALKTVLAEDEAPVAAAIDAAPAEMIPDLSVPNLAAS